MGCVVKLIGKFTFKGDLFLVLELLDAPVLNKISIPALRKVSSQASAPIIYELDIANIMQAKQAWNYPR